MPSGKYRPRSTLHCRQVCFGVVRSSVLTDGSEISLCLVRLAEEELVVDILLCGDERRFGKALVVARNLNLLTVLVHFLKIVVIGSEFLKFLFEIVFHLLTDLIGTFSDDAYSLVDVTCLLRQLDGVAGDCCKRSVCFLVIHRKYILEWRFNNVVSAGSGSLLLDVAAGDFQNVVGLAAVGSVWVVVDK